MGQCMGAVHGGHGTVAEQFCGRRGRRERGDGGNVAPAPAREAQKAGARGAPTMAVGETETDGRRETLGTAIRGTTPLWEDRIHRD
jgi:hypothetical protein